MVNTAMTIYMGKMEKTKYMVAPEMTLYMVEKITINYMETLEMI